MAGNEDPISVYIDGFTPLDHPFLAELTAREGRETGVAPSIGPQAGRLLGLLIRLMGAQRVLELGTCLGYSTIWLATALRATGGRLVSVELDERMVEETHRSLQAAGLADVVELIHGDAEAVVATLQGPFDLVLQDSDKRLYPKLVDRCFDLLRPGGLLVADDALFLPMGVREALSGPIDAYNRRVFSDPRLYGMILPIGDGLALSLKRGG